MCCYKWSTFVDDDYRHTQRVCDVTAELDGLAYSIIRNPCALAWAGEITIVTEGTAPEDVPAFVRLPIVSDRIRHLVESNALTGVSFYRVRMQSLLPLPIPCYWYVHFHYIWDAIDYDRSTWRRMDIKTRSGEIAPRTTILKFVLKRKAIEGWDLFRCVHEGQGTPSIFCSKRFRDLFMAHGCTGLGFDPVPLSD